MADWGRDRIDGPATAATAGPGNRGVSVSLFEDESYQYRDTLFVFMDRAKRPSVEAIKAQLNELGSRYEVLNVQGQEGAFECLTIKSPYDYSAMDIAYTEGEEVLNQIRELTEEFRTVTLVGDDQQKLGRLEKCNARFDIFHFEQVLDSPEEYLDPGGLFIVIQKLAELCDGVGLDPQSQALI